MAAGLATLNLIAEPGFHTELAAKTERLCPGLVAAARQAACPSPPRGWRHVRDLLLSRAGHPLCPGHSLRYRALQELFHGMLAEKVYLAPSAFEAGFMSAAHSADDIKATVAAAQQFLPVSDLLIRWPFTPTPWPRPTRLVGGSAASAPQPPVAEQTHDAQSQEQHQGPFRNAQAQQGFEPWRTRRSRTAPREWFRSREEDLQHIIQTGATARHLIRRQMLHCSQTCRAATAMPRKAVRSINAP